MFCNYITYRSYECPWIKMTEKKKKEKKSRYQLTICKLVKKAIFSNLAKYTKSWRNFGNHRKISGYNFFFFFDTSIYLFHNCHNHDVKILNSNSKWTSEENYEAKCRMTYEHEDV